MSFHPKNLPIFKTYDLKSEEGVSDAVEDMVNLGFSNRKEGFKAVARSNIELRPRQKWHHGRFFFFPLLDRTIEKNRKEKRRRRFRRIDRNV